MLWYSNSIPFLAPMYRLSLTNDPNKFLLVKSNDRTAVLTPLSSDHSEVYVIPIRHKTDSSGSTTEIVGYIKSVLGDYLCSEPGGALICNRQSGGPWETFRLTQGDPVDAAKRGSDISYYLYDYHGKRLFGGEAFKLSLSKLPFANSLSQLSGFYGVDINSLGRSLCDATTNLFSPDFLFSLSAHKEERRRKLSSSMKSCLSTDGGVPVYISSIFDQIHSLHPVLQNFDIRELPVAFEKGQPINDGRPCIVIINNNNINHTYGPDKYVEMYASNPHAWFAVWDYDNHHWISNSFLSALYSDSYVPAHHENIANLSNLAGHSLRVVPCGVSQFLHSDLCDLSSQIANRFPAQSTITGLHRHYKQFTLRNALIEKIASVFPGDVGFTQPNSYNSVDYKQNLEYWSSFALSFVAPVHGDLPIRIFDSISTGSIPLVPFSALPSLERAEIPPTFFIPYNFSDLENPKDFVLRAYESYLGLGPASASERIKYGSNYCHIGASISLIVKICHDMILSLDQRLF